MNDELVQFDIKERLTELYTMAETLFKIKTGKLEKEFVPQIDDSQCIHNEFDPYNIHYDEYDEYEQEYEDEHDYYEKEYTILQKTKGVRMKNKKR